MSVIDLEPLVCLKRARMDIERGNCEYNVTDYLDTIEAALFELKSIKEAKSSEALECLKQIEDVIETKIGLGVVNAYIINIIKQALIKTQKQEKENAEYKQLEQDLCCPLKAFVKLTLTQRIWAESEEMHFISDNFGKFVDSPKWEDRFWCHVDTDFNVDEDNFGETEFWAWYHYDSNGSDHIILKLNEYGTKWWLKRDKSE